MSKSTLRRALGANQPRRPSPGSHKRGGTAALPNVDQQYPDADIARLLLHVMSMSKAEWRRHDEATMVAVICGFDVPQAKAAVERAHVQHGLPPEGDEPTEADRAEMLLSVAANAPPGLVCDRFLAVLRGWPVERARRALHAALLP